MKAQIVTFACLLSLLLLTTTTTFISANSEDFKKPNIILIIADDLGFDDVSFRGSNEFLTPNIDALGYHGIILDRFYAPPLGTASRATLLTGRYPIHTGTHCQSLENGAPGALPSSNLPLMSEIFQNAGYSTNLIGKWNLGHARKQDTPTYRGFDYHFGYWGNHIDHYQRRANAPMECNQSIGYDFRRNLNVECARLGTYVTDLLTDEAERIITEHRNGKPLFLILAHALPHQPLQAPEEELRKFAYIKDPARRTYAAMISILDRSVGRVIRSLGRSNMLENSIVIFSSDNGAASVGMGKNAGSNWPFRGQKDSPWEGGIRLPAVIWSPLLTSARQRVLRQNVYIGDWLPTLTSAAGIEPAENLDAINLWPILSDPSITQERSILHSLDPKRHFISYMMHGQWKYINGTSHNGQYDSVLTYREQYDVDARAQRNYVVEVRNSLTSKALSKFDEQRLTQHRIESLRQSTMVQCGNQQRSCNALVEECLFNIELDPCEKNNLVYETKYREILNEIRLQLLTLEESALVPIDSSCINAKHSDPAWHDCAWSNFMDEESKRRQQCSSEGRPCETAV